MKRVLVVNFAAVLAFSLLCLVPDPGPSTVLAANAPAVTLDIQNASPRQIEDATEKAVARDYAAAWQAMADALDQNRLDLLSANFIGTADDKLTETIQQQKKAGLHRRYVDRGHKVQATFYSSEGSAMELHDTAQLQIQLLDGDKVVASQEVTAHYVVLMTAAENSWKVRVLQEVPAL
ncbi:MAG: hypothetical protein WAM71_21460 [Candidatus Korobacteraceae bacterium]